jgi:hypothetical protein
MPGNDDDPLGRDGFIVTMDLTTRLTTVMPVKGAKAKDAVAALKDYIDHYPTPSIVIADGGTSFKGEFLAFCESKNIRIISSTPYNSKGRGAIERVVGRVKRAVRSILPDNRKLLWAEVLPEIVNVLRTMPHEGLGGLSPEEVAFATPPPPRISAFLGVPVTNANIGDVIDACIATRTLTTMSTEVQALLNKARHDATIIEMVFKVGDTVAVYIPTRESALHSFWHAPHVITADHGGGFYQHAELLAGNVPGTKSNAHASRIIPNNMDRTDATLEMQKKLPIGYHVVEAITDGPREADGRFLVKWALLPNPTWEPAEALRGENHFKAYCAAHNLAPKTGQPLRARTRGGERARTKTQPTATA